MLKEALEYLVGLRENKTYEINGETYSDNDLYRVPRYIPYPSELEVNGLDSIVKLVRRELVCTYNIPFFIRVVGPRKVVVFTILDEEMNRDHLYKAVCDAPDFMAGYRGHENAIIELRSAFVQNEGTEYLLDLLSRICKEDSVTSEDNGVSQTVSARQGISLKQFEQVRSRVSLIPFRTFTEIEQPESEFILRLKDDGSVGLFEADGGMWKLEAKRRIADYFEHELATEIEAGKVVIMM